MSQDPDQAPDQKLDQAVEPLRIVLRQLEEAGAPIPESPAKVISRLSRYTGAYPVRNLPVEVCDKMFAEAVEKALKEEKSPTLAKQAGKLAYCAALPKLSGAGYIRDFIACVTHGMALEIIPSAEGTRLLYAAQVAHMALTKRPKKRGQSSHTSTSATNPTPEESTA